MIERDDIYIDQADHLHLHVIGYKNEGESIVFHIGNKFLGVIDCYKDNDCFKTKEIIEQYGGRVDFVCWTHSDWDHTKGLSELEPYFYDETAVIVPQGIQAKEWREIVLEKNKNCAYQKEEYEKIYAMLERTKEYLYLSVNESTQLYRFNLKHKSEIMEFSMNSFAPMGKIIHDLQGKYIAGAMGSNQQREELFKKLNQDNNLFSVCLQINLGLGSESLCILLTGDLDNRVIQKMNPKSIEKIFSRANVIKIPHHGSSTSDEIVTYNYPKGIKFDYAITTSYKNKLPEDKILRQYNNLGTVINVNQQKEKDAFGIAEYEIPLLNHHENLSDIHNIYLHGNADYYD